MSMAAMRPAGDGRMGKAVAFLQADRTCNIMQAALLRPMTAHSTLFSTAIHRSADRSRTSARGTLQRMEVDRLGCSRRAVRNGLQAAAGMICHSR